jgi:hypothetical protein
MAVSPRSGGWPFRRFDRRRAPTQSRTPPGAIAALCVAEAMPNLTFRDTARPN